ncbi:MAG: Flagellar hook-associated protein [Herminiimonas sp.]|nr:Flagellar hook-associated protein [Herminiimonas sp.]
MANILSVGQSALAAAQAGLVTTGHNIANASTPGYSRQIVVQSALAGQDSGFGYIGKGTEVTGVNRVYNEFLGNQVLSAQTSKSQLDSYYTQIQQINNMVADPTAGLSPALQDFFTGVQNLSADPNSAAARQSLLSSADSLAARFQGLDAQVSEIRQGVNDQITAGINDINVYAKQIAQLNDAIDKAQQASGGSPPNDLLDQRDLAVANLSKDVKVSVVKQNGSYNVYIGNGQPLVISNKTYNLAAAVSPTDPSRVEVAYQNNGTTTILAENGLTGGSLAGLFEFRANTLDPVQNAIGRVATVLATTFNAQHSLGQDQTGALGGKFFNVADPLITASSNNGAGGVLTASISDVGLLTTSDYRLQVTAAAVAADPAATPPVVAAPAAYTVMRLSDGKVFSASPATVDGVDFAVSGTLTAGDEFLVRPTANGANAALGFSVAITDKAAIAAAAPIRSTPAAANTGSGTISAGTVDTPPPPNTDLRQPVKITFTSATTFDVTGTGTGLPANGVAYTPGADISYNGWTVQIAGAPANGDAFTVGPNISGVGDNRNALLLGGLQSANTVDNNSTSLQGAYSQLVNMVGNKTRELKVTSGAAQQLYTSTVNAQQAESGVNLDEEAANLLRYQQAYQAAGKVMQTASALFAVLLTLGG